MSRSLTIALYQPDIPGNTGSILRLAACLALDVVVIGPAGFDLSHRALKRGGMDYLEMASLRIEPDWASFEMSLTERSRRLILLTTKAETPYAAFNYRADDVLLFGRESAGVPDFVHDRADERLTIPMAGGARSLNLAISAAMVAGEFRRQHPLGGAGLEA